jgi:recombination protein RecT
MSNELVEKKQELTNSERFTNKVLAEFKGNVGNTELSNYQKELIKGYFIGIDRALTKAEEGRVSKNQYAKVKEDLPYTWENVNLNGVAIGVVHHAKLGLDMMQDNHLFPIPYKNKKTNKYDITFMKGYKGLEYIVMEHAIVKPSNIITELVYSNDEFEVIKKSITNKCDTYKFTVKNPFNRGEIIGAFGYIEYEDSSKNELIVMTVAEIEKRKPEYASAEFWGGEKDKWVDGQKKGKEPVEGWKAEMYLKTIKRATYNKISIDPKKVNNSYAYVVKNDLEYAESRIVEEIDENANKEEIDIENQPLINIDTETGEILDNTEETLQNNSIDSELPGLSI